MTTNRQSPSGKLAPFQEVLSVTGADVDLPLPAGGSLILLLDPDGSDRIANLPIDPPVSTTYVVKNVGGANLITVTAPAGVFLENMGPGGVWVLATLVSIEVVYDGTAWWITATKP